MHSFRGQTHHRLRRGGNILRSLMNIEDRQSCKPLRRRHPVGDFLCGSLIEAEYLAHYSLEPLLTLYPPNRMHQIKMIGQAITIKRPTFSELCSEIAPMHQGITTPPIFPQTVSIPKTVAPPWGNFSAVSANMHGHRMLQHRPVHTHPNSARDAIDAQHASVSVTIHPKHPRRISDFRTHDPQTFRRRSAQRPWRRRTRQERFRLLSLKTLRTIEHKREATAQCPFRSHRHRKWPTTPREKADFETVRASGCETDRIPQAAESGAPQMRLSKLMVTV